MQQFQVVPHAQQYSKELQDVIKHEMTCCICQMLMKAPVYLNCPAQHVICYTCVTQIENRCPLDRAPINQQLALNQPIKDTSQLSNAVKNLYIACREQHDHLVMDVAQGLPSRYLGRRCEWTGSLRNHDSHKESCIDELSLCNECYQLHDYPFGGKCPLQIHQNNTISIHGPDQFGMVYALHPHTKMEVDAFLPARVEVSICNDLTQIPQKKVVGLKQCENQFISCLYKRNPIICDPKDSKHMQNGCPFDLVFCYQCRMKYFRFHYQEHFQNDCAYNNTLRCRVASYANLPDRSSSTMLRIYTESVGLQLLLEKYFAIFSMTEVKVLNDEKAKVINLGCHTHVQLLCQGLLNFWTLFSIGKFKVAGCGFSVQNKDLITNEGALFYRKVKETNFESLKSSMKEEISGLNEIQLLRRNGKQKTISFYGLFATQEQANLYKDKLMIVDGVKLKGVRCFQMPV